MAIREEDAGDVLAFMSLEKQNQTSKVLSFFLPVSSVSPLLGWVNPPKILGVPEALPHAGTEGDIPFFHGDRVHEKAIGNGHFILYDTG